MEIPRHWRLKKQRYGLVGEVCPRCDHKLFPPKDICPYCADAARQLIESVASSKTEIEVQGVAAMATVLMGE